MCQLEARPRQDELKLLHNLSWSLATGYKSSSAIGFHWLFDNVARRILPNPTVPSLVIGYRWMSCASFIKRLRTESDGCMDSRRHTALGAYSPRLNDDSRCYIARPTSLRFVPVVDRSSAYQPTIFFEYQSMMRTTLNQTSGSTGGASSPGTIH